MFDAIQAIARGEYHGNFAGFRGPQPPALICMACGVVIHAEWEHPLLVMAKAKGWYAGETTGGTCVCPKCDDDYTNRLVSKRHQERLKATGLPLAMQTWTLSTYPGAKHYLKQAEAWLDARERPDVVLYGPPGTAKTGLAVAMMRALMERNQAVKFVRATDLVLHLRDTYRNHEQSELQIYQTYWSVALLVLDDLSALRKSEFFEDTLWTLLDMRQKEKRPTLLTVNLRKEERETFFGPLLFDRLRESAQWWNLDGASVRRPRT